MPQKSWGAKRERRYRTSDQARSGAVGEGRRAVAAATAHDTRSAKGETKSRRSERGNLPAMPVDLARARDWEPPKGWRRVSVVDAHAAGEPLRVVVDGVDPIPGATIVAKRAWARGHLDGLRRGLMFEPRGHADMYGAIVTEPVTPDGDLGVLFMHNEGWSTMCGHGIIALVTVAIETGMLRNVDVVRIDSPAGRITARPKRDGARVASVAFENVPSFVLALDESVDVPGLGRIRYDLAFGGAFYAYVDVVQLGLALGPSDYRGLIDAGWRIKKAVMAARPVPHPFEPELSFLYGTILGAPAVAPGANARNVCVFADGEVDRSPTGTGVSGRVAIEHARGQLKIDEPFVVESIIGTRFTGRVIRETTFGPHRAVIPEVAGSAWSSGRTELWFDPNDPLREGFILR